MMRWLVVLLLLTGVAVAQSQQPPLDQRPAEQTGKDTAAKSNTSDQISKPAQPPTAIPQVPAPTLAVEKAPNTDTTAQQPEKSWWEKVRSDPNALFAGAVALFTLALVIVGSRQSRQLKRSVDLLAKAERSQMFVVVHSEHLRMLISTAERHAEQGPDEEGVIYADVADVTYSFKNYGKTPAIVREISARLVYGAKPPEEPTYIPTDQVLQEHMIASGDSTAIITPLDDVRPHRCQMDEGLTIQEANAVVRAQSYIWFYGRVLYQDIFGQEREHRFLWRYGGAHGFRPNYEYPNYVKNT
jgi:hypothetical protein